MRFAGLVALLTTFASAPLAMTATGRPRDRGGIHRERADGLAAAGAA